MSNPTFRVRLRLMNFVKRITSKQGLGMSAPCQQMMEGTVRKGINRMETQGVAEKEDKIRLAEDNLRRLIVAMGGFSVDTGSFPIIDNDCFDLAMKKVCPIWPFC
ncbi:hypothetical protein ACFL17_00675 [Pseudomonadota bacterium]